MRLPSKSRESRNGSGKLLTKKPGSWSQGISPIRGRLKIARCCSMKRRNRAASKPKYMYADGCFAYLKGFNNVFYDHHNSCKLVQKVGIRSKTGQSQNVIERLHGTLKDMLRARRGNLTDAQDRFDALRVGVRKLPFRFLHCCH